MALAATKCENANDILCHELETWDIRKSGCSPACSLLGDGHHVSVWLDVLCQHACKNAERTWTLSIALPQPGTLNDSKLCWVLGDCKWAQTGWRPTPKFAQIRPLLETM